MSKAQVKLDFSVHHPFKICFSDVSNTYVMQSNANELLKNQIMRFSGFLF